MKTRTLAALAAFTFTLLAITGCGKTEPPLTNSSFADQFTTTPQVITIPATTADQLRADLVVVSVDNVPYGTFPRSSIIVTRNAIIIPSCEPLSNGLPDGCAENAASAVIPPTQPAPTAARPQGPQPTGITAGFAQYREPAPQYTKATRPLPNPDGTQPPCVKPQYTCDNIPAPYREDQSL